MTLRSTTSRLLLLLALLPVAGCDGDQPVKQPTTEVEGVRFTLVEAIEIAKKDTPGGTPFEAELEAADEPRFEVELGIDGDLTGVLIDAWSGEVTGHFRDGEDVAEAMAAIEVLAAHELDLADAVELAEDQLDGFVFEAEVVPPAQVLVVVRVDDETHLAQVSLETGIVEEVG